MNVGKEADEFRATSSHDNDSKHTVLDVLCELDVGKHMLAPKDRNNDGIVVHLRPKAMATCLHTLLAGNPAFLMSL